MTILQNIALSLAFVDLITTPRTPVICRDDDRITGRDRSLRRAAALFVFRPRPFNFYISPRRDDGLSDRQAAGQRVILGFRPPPCRVGHSRRQTGRPGNIRLHQPDAVNCPHAAPRESRETSSATADCTAARAGVRRRSVLKSSYYQIHPCPVFVITTHARVCSCCGFQSQRKIAFSLSNHSRVLLYI